MKLARLNVEENPPWLPTALSRALPPPLYSRRENRAAGTWGPFARSCTAKGLISKDATGQGSESELSVLLDLGLKRHYYDLCFAGLKEEMVTIFLLSFQIAVALE